MSNLSPRLQKIIHTVAFHRAVGKTVASASTVSVEVVPRAVPFPVRRGVSASKVVDCGDVGFAFTGESTTSGVASGLYAVEAVGIVGRERNASDGVDDAGGVAAVALALGTSMAVVGLVLLSTKLLVLK